MKEFLKEKKTLYTLFLILSFGFLIRIINLTHFPIFVDEAIYVRWSQVMKAESTLRFLPLSDGKQPLFMWVTIPFLKLFSDPLFAGRIVSVLSGVGTIFGVFVISFLLFRSKKTSLVTAFAYSISPFSVFFDRLALVDSLLAFFSVWLFVFSFLTFKTKRLDFAMISGFLLGGALLTKSPALFLSILLPVTFLVDLKSLKNKISLAKTLILYFITYTIGYGLYNILRLGPNFHLITERNRDYVFPISHLFSDPFNPLVGHIGNILNWFLYFGTGVLLILVPISGFYLFKKHKNVFWFLFLIICLPLFAQSVYAKVFTARYILFVVPFVFIFSFASLNKLSNNTSKIVNFIIIIFVLTSAVQNFLFLNKPELALLPRNERSGYLEEWSSGYGIKEVSEYIENQYLSSSDKIVVGTEGYFGTLPDGLQIYLNKYPDITIIGVGLNLVEVPNSLLESKNSGNKTYLVINDSRLVADPKKLGLIEIASYPKARRTNGTVENLKLFEVK